MSARTPTVRNMSRRYFEACEPGDNAVAVSITAPNDPAHVPRRYWATLRLVFDDWDPDSHGQPAGKIIGCAEPVQLFTEEHAARIVAFTRMAEAARADIFVHCQAGVSRSGAVVEVLLEALPGYVDRGDQRRANNYVRRLLRRAFGLVPGGVIVPERARSFAQYWQAGQGEATLPSEERSS